MQPQKKLGPVAVERTLPNNLEAERAVLGAILLDNQAINAAMDCLSPEDFFLTQNRHIFQGMIDLREKNQGIDVVTLMEYLNTDGKLEAAGGPDYLSMLPDGLPRKTNVIHYGHIVRKKASFRRIIFAAHFMESSAFEETLEPNKIADDGIQALANLTQAELDSGRLNLRQATMQLLGELDQAQDSKILTNIPKIDEVTGGFRGGELILLTAETGAGKSFFALQLGQLACVAGEHGLYCSGEMRAAHLMGRRLSSTTGVAHSKIRRPSQLTLEDFSVLAMAASTICETCEILEGELTLPRIRSAARAMGKDKIRFLIVDYDELVEVADSRDEWDAQRTMVRALKSLGMELNIPVFLISQLRKALEKVDRARPTLQRIYGSGSKTKHASIVLYIDRPFVVEMKGDATDATIYVLKNRDGRLGRTAAKFNIHTFRFEQCDELEPMHSRKIKHQEEDDDV